MKTKGMKVVKELPDNMTGHIIVFEDPLFVHVTISHEEDAIHEGKKCKRHWEEPTGEIVKCNFMRAEGGFGSYKVCSGRMIIGNFFRNIQDVIDNKPFQGGNTKCYPDGFIPELFTEHEKL